MTFDEGVIKYRCVWRQAPLPETIPVAELERWRRPLFEAGLIGHDVEHDVGYGNLSIRLGDSARFLVSGTQTGHLARTDESHYALVTSASIADNTVHCTGPVQASSEAMTHAAVYELAAVIGAIVHVHSRELWNKYLNRLPTTDPGAAYGTPAMAAALQELYRSGDLDVRRVAVMGGHQHGLLALGGTLAEAAENILALLDPGRTAHPPGHE